MHCLTTVMIKKNDWWINLYNFWPRAITVRRAAFHNICSIFNIFFHVLLKFRVTCSHSVSLHFILELLIFLRTAICLNHIYFRAFGINSFYSTNFSLNFRPTSSSKKLFCNPYGPPIYPRERPVISVEENQGDLLKGIDKKTFRI